MTIDHIGYAVKNIDKARKRFEDLGFDFDDMVTDDSRHLYIQFGIKDGYKIELVSPMDGGSPVDGILGAVGSTPYHICYRSDDMKADIEKLQNQRYKVIIPEAKAIALDGRNVVFMMNRDIGLIEIVEASEQFGGVLRE